MTYVIISNFETIRSREGFPELPQLRDRWSPARGRPGPVRFETDGGAWQVFVDYAVLKFVNGGANFTAIGNIDQNRPPRLCAIIHANRVFVFSHHASFSAFK
jgi:hypothetical protein